MRIRELVHFQWRKTLDTANKKMEGKKKSGIKPWRLLTKKDTKDVTASCNQKWLSIPMKRLLLYVDNSSMLY